VLFLILLTLALAPIAALCLAYALSPSFRKAIEAPKYDLPHIK